MVKAGVSVGDFSAGSLEFPGAGQPWLRDLREKAASRFESLGLPSRRWEDWKYTDMSKLVSAGCKSAPAAAGIHEEEAQRQLASLPASETVSHVLFLDGLHVPAPARLQPLPEGVRLASLRQLLDEDPEFLESRIARCASIDDHPFVALNTALMQDGLVLHLAPGSVVEQPINLVFRGSEGAEPRGVHTRVLVVAEEGSRAVIFESHGHETSGTRLTNLVTEVHLGENATLDHYRLQNENLETDHISMLAVDQARGSTFSSGVVLLGGKTSRNEIRVRLLGSGARCKLEGVWLGSDRQHHDTHTHIDHAVPHTTSVESYKGIMDDRATGAFTGRVLVREDAQDTNASQQNKNLLLSRDAVVNSRPQLEIYADDVKCSHGATTGRLDPAAMFYLRSRGIPHDHARRMLTSAFAWGILDNIDHEQVREYLKKTVSEYLGEHVEVPSA